MPLWRNSGQYLLTVNEKLLGVVLCGGESRRMGQDKGLIKNGNETWAGKAGKKLEALGLKTVFSVNSTQLPFYREVFTPESLIQDSLSIPGPLNGLLSTHLIFPERDLLVFACDLTEMEISVLELLCTKYTEQPGAEFYYFTIDGQKEPLAAIYRKEALNTLLQQWTQGSLTGFSLQKQLRDESSCTIPSMDGTAFLNANTMDIFKGRKN